MPSKRITLTPAANGSARATPFVLVDWTDIIIDNPELEPEFELQVVKYLRGTAPAFFDRGNEQDTLRFVFATLWDTLEEAEDWALGVRGKVPRIAAVKIESKGYTGVTLTRSMASAAIRVGSMPNRGLTTYTRVQIVGGPIS